MGIDLLVIGGGPAGSTLAGLVKKHDPGRRVVLLEKAPGPRHHVGESLLPGVVPVLKELGAFDKVDGAGFPRKLGATYIWGRDRTPWENDFNDVNVDVMLERYGTIPERIEYAWQVRRSEYDEILLKHAEELGVEVLRGARAAAILEEGETVTGVRLADGTELRAAMTADCSGQDGFLSKFRKIRKYNDTLRNVSGYAYYRGAKWKYEYTGHPDKTKIFICTVKSGWLWYIPVDKDVVSVGLVTTVEQLKREGGDLKALFLREAGACDEIAPLLSGAERVAGYDGTTKDFHTHKDWSYLSEAACGPGWLAAGDAAVFVDPILSSGVTLAQLCAHRAAYSLLTTWESPDLGPLLWSDYDLFCRESASQYFVLALFWYGNDPSAESWWGRAAEIQRAWLPVPLSDKGAFVAVSAGLTQYYDRLFSMLAAAEEQMAEPREYPFFMAVFQPDAPRSTPALEDVPRLLFPYDVAFAFVPDLERALLRPVKRVLFRKETGPKLLADALNPRKVVTRYHLTLLEELDGRRTLGEVLAAAQARGVPRRWLDGPARLFLGDLAVQGVLEVGVPA